MKNDIDKLLQEASKYSEAVNTSSDAKYLIRLQIEILKQLMEINESGKKLAPLANALNSSREK